MNVRCLSTRIGRSLAAALLLICATAVTGFGQQAPPAAAATASSAPDLYASEPVPLTPVQCGQCHSSIYGDLKNNGGRHKFVCSNCHTRFHAYNPSKQNWQELMPKCANCHVPPPHGPKLTECSNCHSNPHAPKKMPMSTMLVNSCSICHAKPFETLKQFPSKHTKLQCQNCHTSHGYIPSCSACHKPHYQDQPFATCAKECHPVHMPLQITYKKDVNTRTCGACHDAIYTKWSKSPSKHAKVSCAACHHTKHGYIPACTECHKLPHSKQLHERFPLCLTCHQDPHDPPVKRK